MYTRQPIEAWSYVRYHKVPQEKPEVNEYWMDALFEELYEEGRI